MKIKRRTEIKDIGTLQMWEWMAHRVYDCQAPMAWTKLLVKLGRHIGISSVLNCGMVVLCRYSNPSNNNLIRQANRSFISLKLLPVIHCIQNRVNPQCQDLLFDTKLLEQLPHLPQLTRVNKSDLIGWFLPLKNVTFQYKRHKSLEPTVLQFSWASHDVMLYNAAIGLGCQGPFHSTLSTSS